MENQLMVQEKNLEQVPQELLRLKNGDEKFELAIQGKKILVAPIEEIKEVLRLAMLKLGLRGNNLPDEEEKQVLINHIIENYGRHTCKEISLAFDLAISGELNLEEKEVKAYENFSCLYFSSIMNAYRKWSIEPNNKFNKKERRLELPYSERGELNDTEMSEWIKEWTTKKLESNNALFYVPVMFYDWLSNKNKLILTDEQKNEYFQRSIKIRESELLSDFVSSTSYQKNYDDFMTQKEIGKFSYSNTSYLKNLSKKMAAFDYLKEKSNDNS